MTLIALIIAMTLFSICVMAQSEKKPVYSSNSREKGKIALTFDDGPHPRNTPEILEVLDTHGVKATFFVIGVNAKNYPKALSMMVNGGHEIGNHTYSHSIMKDKTREQVNCEIVNAEKEIERSSGKNTVLLRPPCGLYDKNTVRAAMEREYKIVLWNIDTHDWAHATTEEIISTVVNNVKGGDIILFHDYISGKSNTAEALKTIIPELKKIGYEFVTVSELLQNL